jgi:hypothetical protein
MTTSYTSVNRSNDDNNKRIETFTKDCSPGDNAIAPERIKEFSHSPLACRDGSNQTNRNKVVAFLPTVTVRRIPSRSYFSKDDIAAIWYTEEDYRRIQATSLKLINILNLGGRSDSDRGLEGYTLYGRRSKAHNREASIEVVLDEQCNQWIKYREIKDDDILASRYRRITSSSQLWARSVGFSDQRAAEACYDLMEMEQIRLQAKACSRADDEVHRKSSFRTSRRPSAEKIARAA